MEQAKTHIIYYLDTSLIYADEEFNCRGKIQPYCLIDLASSIKDHGLQIPVIVWEKEGLPNGCRFLLVVGYRRYLTCTTILRQTTILATVRTDLTEETARILNFTENLERKDLNILEEARALAISFPKHMALVAVGRQLNRGPMWVKVRRMLLELPEAAQEAAAMGLFTIDDIKLASSTSYQHVGRLVDRIIQARREGKSVTRVTSKFKRKVLFTKPRTDDVKSLICYLTENKLSGLATKVLLYTLGKISSEEIYQYINRILEKDRIHEEKKHASKQKRT